MNSPLEDALVIGTGGHSRFVLSLLNQLSKPVKGLITLDESFDPHEQILDKHIVGNIDDLPNFFNLGVRRLFLAVGNNEIRGQLFNRWMNFGFSFPSVKHPKASVDATASIGIANVIGPNAVIGADVRIETNNILNSSCTIEHESVVGNHCHIAPGAVICGRVVIGDEVMVGANSTIIENIKVANKTVLGAGSTLTNSVYSEKETLVGSPAKRFHYRN